MICNTTAFWQDTTSEWIRKQLSHYNFKFIDLDKTSLDSTRHHKTHETGFDQFLWRSSNKLINLISSSRMLILCSGRCGAPFHSAWCFINCNHEQSGDIYCMSARELGCLNISRYHQIFMSRNIKCRRAITENQSKYSQPLSIFIAGDGDCHLINEVCE